MDNKSSIPVAIIIGCVILGVFYYLSNKNDQTSIKQPIVATSTVKESITTTPKVIKTQPTEVKVPQPPTNPYTSNNIEASEINPYIIGVVEVDCHGTSPTVGSGSLWNLNGKYRVLTNRHVLSTSDCRVYVDDSDHKKGGSYLLDLNNVKAWNLYTDVGFVPILGSDGTFPNVTPLPDLFYGIGNMQKCSSKVVQGSPVYIIGYPSSSTKKNYVGNDLYFQAFRTLTTGVVSGFDDSVVVPNGNLPYPNYFISAKIDSGNSGGVAISKENGKLCLLGIPTWLNIGNYDSQGIVQNINNVLYTPN